MFLQHKATADKPSKTWDGLPQGDPLSTLLFSTVMSEVVSQAVCGITSEVHVVSYVDDTILTGPAEEITKILQQLPSLLQPSGLELQPAKTQIWAPHSECLRRTPLLRDLRNKMKDPRGLIVVGEALGNPATDSFPVGDEAFVADHLRGVADNILADLRKIGCLPDKLQSGQGGVQVAWALIAKTLPPRVVHLLRAHPVSETTELTEMLQEGLQDAVRQLMGVPSTHADQLHVARLPVSAGGLGLPHLPSLAVIARCSALATMPRAADTASYRQTLLDSESDMLFHRLRDVCDRDPVTLAGNLVDPPPGLSLRHLSRKLTHSRDSAAINALWLRRAELSEPLRHAWLRNLPGDNPARPEAHHGQGDWLHTLPGKWSTTLLDPVFRWGLQQRLGFNAPGAGEPCGRTPQGVSDATTSLTRLAGMLVFATKGSIHADMIECVITLLWWPARRDSQHRLNKTCLCRVRPWTVVSLPRAVSDPSTVRTCTSLNQRVPNSGLMCAFTLLPQACLWHANFSEKSRRSAELMARSTGTTSTNLTTA